MDKNQAFEILIQATGALKESREVHVQIQKALDVVKAIIEKPAESKETV